MTKREAQIVTAYTGYMLCNMSELREYAEEKLDERGLTDMAMVVLKDRLQEAAKPDFVALEYK